MNAIELDKNTSFLPYLQLLLDPLPYPLPNFMSSSPLPSSSFSSSFLFLLILFPLNHISAAHTHISMGPYSRDWPHL